MGAPAQHASAAWILPFADVLAWLDHARPGEWLLYAQGPFLIRGETATGIGALIEAKRIDAAQPRSVQAPGFFDFKIQKRTEPGQPPAPLAPEPDLALEKILKQLRREANLGLRCSTDTELAKIAGLATRNQSAARVRKLVQAKIIRTRRIETGPDAGWRVVTILATGRQTALPPGELALRATIARQIREDDEEDRLAEGIAPPLRQGRG